MSTMLACPAVLRPDLFVYVQYGDLRLRWRALAQAWGMTQVRSEDAVVAVIHAALAPSVPAATRAVVVDALLAASPAHVRAAVAAQGPLTSRKMVGTRRPDLLLVDEHDVAVMVIEAKMRRGRMQASKIQWLLDGPWFPAGTGLVSKTDMVEWARTDPAGEVWQVDVAVSHAGFVPKDVTLNPRDVVWLWWAADPEMTVEQAYPGCLGAASWTVGRHRATAQALRHHLTAAGHLNVAGEPTGTLDLAQPAEHPDALLLVVLAALDDPWL